MIYLDYNSTTPVLPEVIDTYKESLEQFGNPSNVYKIGREAKKRLEECRREIAEIIGAEKDEIVFTSGGTISNNLSLQGLSLAYGVKKKGILCSMIEHSSVINTINALSKRSFKASFIPVDKDCIVQLDALKRMINDDIFLIACMWANNETGAIQPIYEISEIIKGKNIFFHCDAVQVVGKIKINMKELNISTLSASAHKFYGPKGVGFLYVNKKVKLLPILFGGHQEREIFPGTENLPGIVAMTKALSIVEKEREKEALREKTLKERFFSILQSIYPKIKLNSHFDKCLPGTLNVSFVGKNNSDIMMKLDEKCVYVGKGSACKTGEDKPSHVLLAMGLKKEEYEGAIRISFGRFFREEDLDKLKKAFVEVLQ